MNVTKNDILIYVEKVIYNNLATMYQNDLNSFFNSNKDVNTFVNNNVGKVMNEQAKQMITSNVSQEEYIGIINKIKANLSASNLQQDISVRKVMAASDVQFMYLKDINSYALDETNRQIYDKAIALAMRQTDSHNIQIGIKNNNLVPIMKDINGNIIEWQIDDKNQIVVNDQKGHAKVLKPAKANDDKGFSDALILSFIIGSFIGIIFLNIYSRFMK